MNEYMDEEREGRCLLPLLIGIIIGLIGFGILKFIIRVITFIASHF